MDETTAEVMTATSADSVRLDPVESTKNVIVLDNTVLMAGLLFLSGIQFGSEHSTDTGVAITLSGVLNKSHERDFVGRATRDSHLTCWSLEDHGTATRSWVTSRTVEDSGTHTYEQWRNIPVFSDKHLGIERYADVFRGLISARDKILGDRFTFAPVPHEFLDTGTFEWGIDSNFDDVLPLSTEQRLGDLASLPSNWYEDSGNSITRHALSTARKILVQALRKNRDRLARPFIAPSPDGGVALRWRMPQGNELHFEIDPGGHHVEYLLIQSTHGEEEETEGTLIEVDLEVAGLLDRI